MASSPTQPASLTAHVSWLMAAKTAGYILSVALPLLLVRRLDQQQFGLYKQVFLVVFTASVVLPLGFGMSAYYFIPRNPEHKRPTVLNILIFNCLVGLLAVLWLSLFPGTLALLFKSSALVPYAPVIGVVIALWILGSALEILPIASGETKTASAFIVMVQFTRTSLFVLCTLVFGTVPSLIYAAVAQAAFQCLLLLYYVQSRYSGWWRHFDWPFMKAQLAYALPLGFAGMLYAIQSDLHNYIVSSFFGPATFAIYSVGTFQLPLIGLLQEATTAVLIPRVGSLHHQGQSREILLLTTRAMRKLSAVYFPVFALMIVVGRELIQFLFTPRYVEAWSVFSINLLLLPLLVVLQDPLFRAYADQRYYLLRVRFASFTALSLGLLFTAPRFGPVGVISTVVLVTFIERAITSVRFARLVGVRGSDAALFKDIGKLALCAGVAALAAVPVRIALLGRRPIVILLACGVVFLAVYAASILVGGVATRSEKNQLLSKLRLARGFSAPP